MKTDWLPHAILRASSLLAPGDRRAEWLREWRSELWYIPRPGATQFCLGAFQDALWVRRHSASAMRPAEFHPQSPLASVAWLTVAALVSLAIALRLPAPQVQNLPAHLRPRDLPAGCCVMALFTCLMLPPIWWAMARAPKRVAVSWPNRVRAGAFLALKIALVHPMMLVGFLISDAAAPVVPVAMVGIFATWVLAFRWVLADQRRRCPVCLHLLSAPLRIGAASQTLLEWYGTESVCARGHGMLHSAEIPSSYSDYPQWHRLDDSWQSLFLGSSERR